LSGLKSREKERLLTTMKTFLNKFVRPLELRKQANYLPSSYLILEISQRIKFTLSLIKNRKLK